jgi:vanillate/3-O-methylgallate O-demethylase
MTKEIINQLRAVTPGYHMGWGGPEYSSWQDEQMSWKRTCYIGDWSFLMDVVVEGPEALKFFRDHAVNSFEKFGIGQCKHMVICNSAGKVIAEGILQRLAEDKFSTQATTATYTEWKLGQGGYDCTFRRQRTFQYQVSGPTALAVCEAVTGESLTDVKFMWFKELTIAGRPVTAVRQGMAGEIGFEFHGALEDAEAVRQAILDAGEPHGIRRLGHRTASINHLEAAFPTNRMHYLADMFSKEVEGYAEWVASQYATKPVETPAKTPFFPGMRVAIRGSYEGDSIEDYLRSPVELGWGKSIKFDHDYPGKAALEEELANPKRLRVTLELNNEDMIDIYASLFGEDEPYYHLDIPYNFRSVFWQDKVLKDGRLVGASTIPGYSYYFRKVLALAYLEPALCEPGTEVTVIWGDPGTRQKEIRATVAPAPYKADNRRQALTTA